MIHSVALGIALGATFLWLPLLVIVIIMQLVELLMDKTVPDFPSSRPAFMGKLTAVGCFFVVALVAGLVTWEYRAEPVFNPVVGVAIVATIGLLLGISISFTNRLNRWRMAIDPA